MPPPGEAMEDWQILVNLGAALGVPFDYTSAAHVRARYRGALSGRRRSSRALTALAFGRPLRRGTGCRRRIRRSGGSGTSCSRISRRSKARSIRRSLPLPPGAIPLKEVKIAHRGHNGTRTQRLRWALAIARLCASVSSVRCVRRARRVRRRGREPSSRRSSSADGVHAGDAARVALQVSLPEGLHTPIEQAARPALIPTVLTIDAPAGMTVDEIVYPHADRLQAAGRPRSAARRLRTRVRHRRAGDARPDRPGGRPRRPGAAALPGLRRQRCVIRRRLPTVSWTLRVVPAAAAANGHGRPAVRDDRVRQRQPGRSVRRRRRGRVRRRRIERGRCGGSSRRDSRSDAASARRLHGARHDRRLSRTPAIS